MWLLSVTFCLLCAAAAVVLAAGAVIMHIRRVDDRRCEQRYGLHFMQLIAARMLSGEGAPTERFSMCGRHGARRVLVRQLATASASTSFAEAGVVRRMVVANGVERWLLRRVKYSSGYARNRYMAMFASLPVSLSVARRVEDIAFGGNCHTRFLAMLVRIAAEPAETVRMVGAYPRRLTRLELAELTVMLRRGIVPLVYTPLLASPNVNLKMLGLNIIRIFGIAEAEERLHLLIAETEDEDVCCEALFTLVSLHLSVACRSVAARIRAMDADRRQDVLRHMAAEGYSTGVISCLAAAEEREYAASLAASYKRRLVCHWQM